MPPVAKPEPEGLSQDQLNLFLLNELERLNILIGLLAKRGSLKENDVALAQLKQDLRHEERLFKVAEGRMDRGSANACAHKIAAIREAIEAIEAAL